MPFNFFPKSFAFPPNGAWSLSASRRCRYLASHGIYHPLWAPLPSNPTRRKRSLCRGLPGTDGILTLYDALFYTLHFAAPKRHRDALLHHPQLPLTAIVPSCAFLFASQFGFVYVISLCFNCWTLSSVLISNQPVFIKTSPSVVSVSIFQCCISSPFSLVPSSFSKNV